MHSFIQLVSKFTPELLLFEGLLITLFLGLYAVLWLRRKQRFGKSDELVPLGLVKEYLEGTIVDAESMLAQILGMKPKKRKVTAAASQTQSDSATEGAATGAGGGGGANSEELKALEEKLKEAQSKIRSISGEKDVLAKELEAAKAAGAGAAAASATPAAGNEDLQRKIEMLEAKLAEYSVIEDDLANLKKLQQENAKLKAQLGGGSAAAAAPSAPEAAPSAAPVTPAPAASTPTPAPAVATPAPTPEAAPAPAAAPAAATPAPAPASAGSPQAEVDALLQQVDQSLAGGAAPAASPGSKGEADLLNEFEKMLNG